MPNRDNYRGEHQFTAGWIALRFLNDPKTALAHFAKIGQGTSNPITLARAGYWQGRAAEALGKQSEARAHYEAAARYSTAYYGQIARARLGHKDIVVRPPPEPTLGSARPGPARSRARDRNPLRHRRTRPHRRRAGRARRPLERRRPRSRRSPKSPRTTTTRAPCCCSARRALGRGLPLDHYAFPTIGLPELHPIGPEIEPALVYAIARQESTFNPEDRLERQGAWA